MTNNAKRVILVNATFVFVDTARHVRCVLQHRGATKHVCHRFRVGALLVVELFS